MSRYIAILLSLCLSTLMGQAQTDSTQPPDMSGIFNRIAASLKDYRPDTTTPPDDRITRKIMELRNLRGGFNINEAISFKIEEDRQKGEVPKEELDKIETFFKSGNGKKWLDNTAVWIYRRHFTYKELKQLVKFYRTPAGQKMATDFPVIMIQSLRAAELIKELYGKG